MGDTVIDYKEWIDYYKYDKLFIRTIQMQAY